MKEFQKSGELRPCKLESSDLLKLVEILETGFVQEGDKRRVTVSTNLPNVRIESGSLQDFLQHQELPDTLTALSLWVSETDKHFNTVKRTLLEFADDRIRLFVSGVDETWVYGKFVQIGEFLNKKKPWFWVLRKIFDFAFGFLVTVSLFATFYFIVVGRVLYAVSSGILFVAWVLAFVFFLKGTFLPYTQIILQGKTSLLTKENITIVIALLTLIISVIGGLVLPLVK